VGPQLSLRRGDPGEQSPTRQLPLAPPPLTPKSKDNPSLFLDLGGGGEPP